MAYLVSAFQIPNDLVDRLLIELSPSALKCYLVIVRKTIGWGKEFDAISASQFAMLTGIRKSDTIWAAIRELKGLGLIKDISAPGRPTKFKVVTQAHPENEDTPKNGLPRQDRVTPAPKKRHTLKRGTQNSSFSKPNKPTISSSSLPPPSTEDEEEAVISNEIVPSLYVPSQLSHLTEDIIFKWINQTSERSGITSSFRYRSKLLKKLKQSDPETMENILIFAKNEGKHKPRSRTEARALGQIIGELSALIILMKKHGESEESIIREVKFKMKKAIQGGEIMEEDLPKIEKDIKIIVAMGGEA